MSNSLTAHVSVASQIPATKVGENVISTKRKKKKTKIKLVLNWDYWIFLLQ